MDFESRILSNRAVRHVQNISLFAGGPTRTYFHSSTNFINVVWRTSLLWTACRPFFFNVKPVVLNFSHPTHICCTRRNLSVAIQLKECTDMPLGSNDSQHFQNTNRYWMCDAHTTTAPCLLTIALCGLSNTPIPTPHWRPAAEQCAKVLNLCNTLENLQPRVKLQYLV